MFLAFCSFLYQWFGFVSFQCLFYLVLFCFFPVGYCSLVFLVCYLFFVFFSVENFIARILKYNLPDSQHWFREGYLFFSFCQSSQKFWNIFWKCFCFKIEVFNFQYPVPETLVFLIFILSWIASWSERPFGTMQTFFIFWLFVI